MTTLIPSIILLLLALTNASHLYYHQSNSGLWLPREEGVRWRLGLVDRWIEGSKRIRADELGYESYDKVPDKERVEIDLLVEKEFPKDQMDLIRNENVFIMYVQGYGMWQWPLTILAFILSTISFWVNGRRYLISDLVCLTFSTILLADATYRSYFMALGF